MSSVFKIEVFDALQTRFGPSQYTSLKYSFKSQPQIENEDVTWSPRYNLPATRTNKHRALSLQEVELDGWFLIYSHCTENMYHIIHAQVYYEFCISFLYSWIDVLDSNQPFDWGAKIWEPFKMKLIWGLQSWPLCTITLQKHHTKSKTIQTSRRCSSCQIAAGSSDTKCHEKKMEPHEKKRHVHGQNRSGKNGSGKLTCDRRMGMTVSMGSFLELPAWWPPLLEGNFPACPPILGGTLSGFNQRTKAFSRPHNFSNGVSKIALDIFKVL